MFCPLCKTEYREGYFTCADCSVPLVAELPQTDELPEEKATHESRLDETAFTEDYIEIYRTQDISEILTIKSAFEEEGIPNSLADDSIRMFPTKLARIFVPTRLRAKALEVLRELQIAV